MLRLMPETDLIGKGTHSRAIVSVSRLIENLARAVA